MPKTTGGTHGRSPTNRLVQHDSTRTQNAGRINQERIKLDTHNPTATSLRKGQNAPGTAAEVYKGIVLNNPQRIKKRQANAAMQRPERREHIR